MQVTLSIPKSVRKSLVDSDVKLTPAKFIKMVNAKLAEPAHKDNVAKPEIQESIEADLFDQRKRYKVYRIVLFARCGTQVMVHYMNGFVRVHIGDESGRYALRSWRVEDLEDMAFALDAAASILSGAEMLGGKRGA